MNISRLSFVRAWLIYLFIVVLSTELLSQFNLINTTSILLIYLGIIIYLINQIKRKGIKFSETGITFLLSEKILFLICTLTIVIPLLVVAVYYPPNNWDSMTYHLPRVMHWIQAGNVEFYPTNNSRQLFMGPVAEYVILHWQLLWRSDIFANLVQYISFLAAVLCSTLISKELGGNRRIQLLTGILTLTIPMGILQSTSTQTDLVTAFCLLAFIYFGLRTDFKLWAISFALGALTKTSFLIFAAPFVVYFGLFWFYKYSHKLLHIVLVSLVIFLLINAPLWYRNWKFYGSILGQISYSRIMVNQSFAPKYVISNIIRNIGLNMGLPIFRYNRVVDKGIYFVHQILGITFDNSINSFLSKPYQTIFVIHEDLSGNFVMTLLIIFAGIHLVITNQKNTSSRIKLFFLLLLVSGLLFSAILKWQPWGTRLQLPLYILFSPLVALILGKYLSNIWIMLFLVGLSLPWVVGNMFIDWHGRLIQAGSTRQIGRVMLTNSYYRFEKYYTANPSLYEQHLLVAAKIAQANITRVGLDLGGDSWEYPLWILLQSQNPEVKIEYIRDNPGFNPQAVIYDETETENILDKNLISSKNDYGLVKVMILKVK